MGGREGDREGDRKGKRESEVQQRCSQAALAVVSVPGDGWRCQSVAGVPLPPQTL